MASSRGWSGPDPADITAWAIVRAGHAVGRRFWAQLGDIGLSPIQFGVLLQLDLNPDMSNADVARSVLVTPQSMSEILASLESAGLIARDHTVGRGRRVPSRLTAAGRRKLVRCARVIDEVERGLGLSATEAARLRTLLDTASSGQTGPGS